MRNNTLHRHQKIGQQATARHFSPMEQLEARQLMSGTYTVTNTSDALVPSHNIILHNNQYVSGSLGWAIQQVNNDGGKYGTDVINFALGSSPQSINLVRDLPAINQSVQINAPLSSAGKPQITLNGIGDDLATGQALVLNGNGSTVQGLAIDYFDVGIVVNGNRDVITHNALGDQDVGDDSFDPAIDVFGSNTKLTYNFVYSYEGDDIQIESGSNYNLISNNTLPENQGIEISNGSAHNTLSQNSTFSQFSSSGVSGIWLDPGDNDGQAAPTLNSGAWVLGTLNNVSGTFKSTPNSTYRIEFFSSPAGTINEGQTYLGYITVTTDGQGNLATASSPAGSGTSVFLTGSSGNYTFNAGFTSPAAPLLGTNVTATATNTATSGNNSGDTSDYSNAQTVSLSLPVSPFSGLHLR